MNNLIPDHQADAFHQDPLQNPGFGDLCIDLLLGGFCKWDGAHFLHIAEHGYTTDRMMAFFPLYPGLVRALADTLFFPLRMVMQLRSVLLVAGWLLNVLMFTLAAVVLYELTKRVCKDPRIADIAWILYCFNPASIFMTAMYTEATFTLLSFSGMLFLEKRRYLISAILFGLGTCARSNGIVSIGFVAYHTVQLSIFVIARIRSPINLTTLKGVCRIIVVGVTRIFYSAAIILFPCALYQIYSYLRICNKEKAISFREIIEHSMEILFTSASNRTELSQTTDNVGDRVPIWCRKSLVIPYSEVQAEHWNVGLLNYYEFKQLPNFFLALPVTILCLYGVQDYCSMKWDHVKVLGLLQPIRRDVKKTDDPISQSEGFYSAGVFVYLVHLLVLLVFGVCCMHVQVSIKKPGVIIKKMCCLKVKSNNNSNMDFYSAATI